ncbi:hypothetical protein ABZ864_40385 [Streptomyces sp. NPDC047082]|uniref:hypothetical protein n=1 Tax=Streptomyces sp. NPDC047082 TaxID=3155259 RepID=UPI0033D99BFD
MHRATPADRSWRRLGHALVAVVVAASAFIVGPSAPEAQAAPNPCNLPGGKYLCKKALDGVVWADKNVPGLHEAGSAVGSAIDTASDVADFATDPLGYIEGKLRGGTKALFEAFGEELTGKKPGAPKKIQKSKRQR